MSVSGAWALRSLGKSSSKSVRAADGSGDGESTSDSTSRSTRARWVGTVRVGVPARRVEASKVRPPSGSLHTRTCCHQPVGSEKSSRRWRPGTLLEPEVGRERVGELAVRQGRRRGPRPPGARGPATARRPRSRRCAPPSCVSARRSLARCTPVSSACTLSRTGSPPWPVPMSRLERLTCLTSVSGAEAPPFRWPSAAVSVAWAMARARDAALSPPIGPRPATTAPGRAAPLLRVREDLAGLDRPRVDAEHRGPRQPPVEQLVEGTLAADEGAARVVADEDVVAGEAQVAVGDPDAGPGPGRVGVVVPRPQPGAGAGAGDDAGAAAGAVALARARAGLPLPARTRGTGRGCSARTGVSSTAGTASGSGGVGGVPPTRVDTAQPVPERKIWSRRASRPSSCGTWS